MTMLEVLIWTSAPLKYDVVFVLSDLDAYGL